jgi:hypothetical protein
MASVLNIPKYEREITAVDFWYCLAMDPIDQEN